MHVHGKSMNSPSLNALLAQSRQSKAHFALANSAVEMKPGLGLGRGLSELKRTENASLPQTSAQPADTDATMDGIHKHWGQNDSPYDLNGDGTVNIDDILHYISGQGDNGAGQPAAQDPATAISAPPQTDSTQPIPNSDIPEEVAATQQPLTLDGFNQNWGQSNAHYDLNADGTVDMDDLLKYLSEQPSSQPPVLMGPTFEHRGVDLAATQDDAAAPNVSSVVESQSQNDMAIAQTGSTLPTISLDGLLGAWGTNDSTFDLNSDGTVNMDDLLAHIAQNSSPTHPDREAKRAAGDDTSRFAAAEKAANLKHGEPAHARMQNLVDSLITRLNETGFEQTPPTNIRDLVDRLNLAPSQMNFVMNRLSERYPLGLGVNLKA